MKTIDEYINENGYNRSDYDSFLSKFIFICFLVILVAAALYIIFSVGLNECNTTSFNHCTNSEIEEYEITISFFLKLFKVSSIIFVILIILRLIEIKTSKRIKINDELRLQCLNEYKSYIINEEVKIYEQKERKKNLELAKRGKLK